MADFCERMMDKILDLVMGSLSEHEIADVQNHLDSCPGCKKYYQQLLNDEALIDSFVEFSEKRFENIQQNVAAAIVDVEQLDCNWTINWEAFEEARNWIRRYGAAAAALLIFAAIGIFLVLNRSDFSRSQSDRSLNEQITQSIKAQESDSVKLELKLVLEYAKAGNANGLMNVLGQGSMPARLFAAKVLAELGHVEALGILSDLAEQYPEYADEFNKAIEIIKAKAGLDSETEDLSSQKLDAAGEQNGIDIAESNEIVSLSGYITDIETGEPVDDAAVMLFGPEQRKTSTDVNGYYAFKGRLLEGLYNVEIGSDGYIGTDFDTEKHAIKISVDNPVAKDYKLEKGCMIELEVVDVNGEAISLTRVTFNQGGEKIPYALGSSNVTDTNGFLLAGAFEPCEVAYNVILKHPNYVSTDLSIYLNDVNMIEYEKVVMERGSVFGGYLYYADGLPAEDLILCYDLASLYKGSLHKCVGVDENGYFELTDAIEAEYCFVAMNGETGVGYPIEDTNLVAGQLLNFTLDCKSPQSLDTITGLLVYDFDVSRFSDRVKAVNVFAKSQDGYSKMHRLKAGENKFSLSLLEPGLYDLWFSGLSIKTAVLRDIPSTTRDLVVNLELALSPILKGVVVDQNGESLQSFMIKPVMIECLDEVKLESKAKWYEFQNTDGYFEMELSGLGIYKLVVRAEGFKETVSDSFELGQQQQIQIKMVPAEE